MATKAVSGFDASISILFNGVTARKIGEARDATLSISQNEIEATSFNSNGWNEYIPGLKEWSIDIEALYVSDDLGQDDLLSALVLGQVVKVSLLPKKLLDVSTNPPTEYSGKKYEGDAFVTSWEINPTPDDVISISASFRGTGELVITSYEVD
jgi:predicted secreted protein